MADSAALRAHNRLDVRIHIEKLTDGYLIHLIAHLKFKFDTRASIL